MNAKGCRLIRSSVPLECLRVSTVHGVAHVYKRPPGYLVCSGMRVKNAQQSLLNRNCNVSLLVVRPGERNSTLEAGTGDLGVSAGQLKIIPNFNLQCLWMTETSLEHMKMR